MWTITFLLFVTLSADASKPCKRLHQKYSGPLRTVRINGEDHEIKVLGAGGAARAEAALLLAGIRHVHRYVAQLDVKETNFCNLTATIHSYVIMAPAAILTKKGCGPGPRTIDPYTSFNAPPSPPIKLYLMGHVPITCADRSRQYRNETLVKYCNSFSKELSNAKNITILARNESSHDKLALAEFKSRALAANIFVTFESFHKDSSYRREVYRRRESNEPFLFIDEQLWNDVPNVHRLQPPPCLNNSACNEENFDLINAVRIGDGSIVQKYAPIIYDTILKFSPNVKTLREILDYEASSEELDVEDAACQWAIENNVMFNELFQYDRNQAYPPHYIIEIFLCKGDPYNKYYERVALSTLKYLNEIEGIKYKLYETFVNCSSRDNLRWGIKSLISKKSVAGAVAWSWDAGVSAASESVKYLELPLKLAGPVKNKVINQATYATSGDFSHLSLAYTSFLSKCSWTRLAIISDETEYSKDFANEILGQNNFNSKNIVVTDTTIATYLQVLRNDDARIFIVNTNCRLATAVLLEAQGVFTPSSRYKWIVREWCLSQVNEEVSLDHYTIDYGWRGGRAYVGSQKLRDDLARIPNITIRDSIISPGISYLADALLLLGHGFAEYYHKDPSVRYDLYGNGSSVKYSTAISTLHIPGVAQSLKVKNNTLYNPVIYVEKWRGNDRRTMAIWQVVNSSVMELWAAMDGEDECSTILDAASIQDAPSCLISSGTSFAPQCYDFAVSLLGVAIIIVAIVLYTLHNQYKKRLSAYNTTLLADILENRHENASSLAKYLVNRGEIKLLHEIGSGCYGRVYFAELNQPGQGPLVVAAKALHESMTTQEENEFLREACILAQLEHRNVIKLMGVCLAKGPPLLLMEHAIYLDLTRYLIERRHLVVRARQGGMLNIEELESVTDDDMTKWATEAASALEYLAMRRLVHRDVRAANCLLNKSRSLKIADFGLARELDVEEPMYMTQRTALFPVLWMAPESLEGGVFGLASDIWALGVLILEIAMMGGRPYGDWPVCRVVRYVIKGGCPPFPPDASIPMRSLLQKCWHRNPELRITATEIRKQLMQTPKIISLTLLLPELPLIPPIEDESFKFIL